MEDKILGIIESICGTDEIKNDRDINLFETSLMDSLGITEFLIQVEEELGIEIAPTEINREDIETPNKIIEYLTKRR